MLLVPEAAGPLWGRPLYLGRHGGGAEGAVRHVRPENWTGSHHSHKQGLWHRGRDAATIWPCDLGQATLPLWASLSLLDCKTGIMVDHLAVAP